MIPRVVGDTLGVMKIDRNTLSVAGLHRQSDDRYWRAQTPVQRLRTMQLDREVAYGRPCSSQRLQRVLEIEPRRQQPHRIAAAFWNVRHCRIMRSSLRICLSLAHLRPAELPRQTDEGKREG